MNERTLIYIVIGLVVVAGLIWLVAANVGHDDGPVGEEVEEQGEITALDRSGSTFTLMQLRAAEERDNFEPLVSETYTVTWTDQTTFKLYNTAKELTLDFPEMTDASALQRESNVAVKGRRLENRIEAVEISIFPSSPETFPEPSAAR